MATVNIGVIGGGAIGLLVSSYLCWEHNVTVYVKRNDQRDKLNNKGLFRSGSPKLNRIKSLLTSEIKSEDCFIICVKQTHVSAILPLLTKLAEHTPLIFLQNGMGHIDLIKNMKQLVFIGVVDHGALKIDDHHVKHTGKGIIKLAAYPKPDQNLSELVTALNQPAFPVCIANNWSQMLEDKLVINAVINPVTALFDINNGEVIHNPYISILAKEICKEATLVLGMDFNEQWQRTKEVARKTEMNISSMLKDIRENRTTELEAITGYLIRKNENNAIPNTWFVYNSIKALEVKKGIEE